MIPAGLESLRDIRLPPDPSVWPPAPGWWLLIALACALGFAMPVLRLRSSRFLARRRDLASYRAIRARAEGDDPGAAAELSGLLRRIAVRRHPDRQPAGLIGTAWLVFLDETSPKEASTEFTEGPGRLLVELPFRRNTRTGVAELVAACRGWVEHNA